MIEAKILEGERVDKVSKDSNTIPQLWKNESQHFKWFFQCGSWSPIVFQIFETEV
jgi:hypothetical protein